MMKPLNDICPYRLGQLVRVRQNTRFAEQWTGTYIVVGLVLRYVGEAKRVDAWLASEDDLRRGVGPTDGWSLDELESAP